MAKLKLSVLTPREREIFEKVTAYLKENPDAKKAVAFRGIGGNEFTNSVTYRNALKRMSGEITPGKRYKMKSTETAADPDGMSPREREVYDKVQAHLEENPNDSKSDAFRAIGGKMKANASTYARAIRRKKGLPTFDSVYQKRKKEKRADAKTEIPVDENDVLSPKQRQAYDLVSAYFAKNPEASIREACKDANKEIGGRSIKTVYGHYQSAKLRLEGKPDSRQKYRQKLKNTTIFDTIDDNETRAPQTIVINDTPDETRAPQTNEKILFAVVPSSEMLNFFKSWAST